MPVLDRVGPEVMRVLGDGDRLRLDGDTLYRGGDAVARGDRLSAESVYLSMERAKAGLGVQLEAFAANTVEHLRQERDLLLDGEGVPDIATVIAGRPVVVVCAGHGWESDLARLRPWIRTASPVLVGVDEGADALVSVGLRPDLVVGNPDLVTEGVLLCGAEVVVRADRNGHAAGLAARRAARRAHRRLPGHRQQRGRRAAARPLPRGRTDRRGGLARTRSPSSSTVAGPTWPARS